ncbi:hypothetical protein SK128_002541, partial [Halocaridina rubra]
FQGLAENEIVNLAEKLEAKEDETGVAEVIKSHSEEVSNNDFFSLMSARGKRARKWKSTQHFTMKAI